MSFYIAVRVGTFASEGAPGSYQIYKSRPNGGYSMLFSEDEDSDLEEVYDLVDNHPRSIDDCETWVVTLNGRS